LAHLGLTHLVACLSQAVKKIWAYKAANSLQNVGFWHFTARDIKYFSIKGKTPFYKLRTSFFDSPLCGFTRKSLQKKCKFENSV
jgi:hypothetical protein